MFNQDFNQWSKDNTLWEPLMKLQGTNRETYEQAMREWTSFMTDSMATLMKGMQTLPRTKSPEDFADAQMKLMTEQGQKFLTCVQNMMEIYQHSFQKVKEQ